MSGESDLAAAGSRSDLVPGDPRRLNDLASLLAAYGADLRRAAQGFASLVPANWSGAAADSFRARFGSEPGRWQAAAEGFDQAARAVSVYATSLALAQIDAGDALTRYRQAGPPPALGSSPYAPSSGFLPFGASVGTADPVADPGAADRAIAIRALEDARERVVTAGRSAASAVHSATQAAPPQASWWQAALSDAVGFTTAAVSIGYDAVAVPAVNAVASVGAAMGANPTASAELLGGALLVGVSGLGEGAGGALSATGVGAVGGVPLIVASTAGIAAGVGLMGVGAAGIGTTAAANPVQVLQRNGDVSAGADRPMPTERPPEVGDDYVPRLANNGEGIVWQKPGATDNRASVRYMDPTDRYPNGYVVYYNDENQALQADGGTGSRKTWHFPMREDGTYDAPKGWSPP